MSLIEIQGISFDYGQGNIFQDLSFQVDRGEIFCLLGPNGCGKTTLLDCLLGILKPEVGRILIDQKDISGLGPRVLEMAMMGRAAYTDMFSSPSDRDREIAEDALGQVGIAHLRERPYTQLSGGELQLVMLARALAQESPIIIMDEPTSHLDFRHELIVLETITGLVHEKDISVIIATHFPNHAFYFEDSLAETRVAMLNDGGFLASGRPREVLNVDNIRKLYRIESNLISFIYDNEKEQRRIIPIRTVK